MPPQAYPIGIALVWNFLRDRDGKMTISQWLRAHPVTFLGALCWFIPHVLIGSNLTDRILRLIGRLR